jgi:Zn finger protein HypA/HybF involved in hydrogenase expression
MKKKEKIAKRNKIITVRCKDCKETYNIENNEEECVFCDSTNLHLVTGPK